MSKIFAYLGFIGLILFVISAIGSLLNSDMSFTINYNDILDKIFAWMLFIGLDCLTIAIIGAFFLAIKIL